MLSPTEPWSPPGIGFAWAPASCGEPSEIGFLHGRIREQLAACSRSGDAPGGDHIAAVRQLQGHARILLDEQDGDAGLVQVPDDAAELLDDVPPARQAAPMNLALGDRLRAYLRGDWRLLLTWR